MQDVLTAQVPHPAGDTDRRELKTARQANLLAEYLNEGPRRTGVPQNTQLDEKAVHTTIAYLMAAGRTRKEIAGLVGMSGAAISEIVRQPWFQTRLKEITDAAGTDMVKAFLHGEVIPSLEVLRDIRDNCDEKGATRVTAANSILDRFMGKPVAHIESKTNLNIHTAADAKDQVESELEKVEAELKARGVKITLAGGPRN